MSAYSWAERDVDERGHRPPPGDGRSGRPERTAPPVAPTPPADESPEQELKRIRIRNDAVHRMRTMNGLHAVAAWDARRSRPIAPHAIAFLFWEPGTQEPLRTATRLFLAGPESRDLHRILGKLTQIADRHLQEGAFDAVATLTDKHDQMSPGAQYLGLGISSLDAIQGTWEETQRTALDALDVPGRIFLELVDGTRVIVDRARNYPGDADVQTTKPLTPQMSIFNTWRWLDEAPKREPGTQALVEPWLARTWDRMGELSAAVQLGVEQMQSARQQARLGGDRTVRRGRH